MMLRSYQKEALDSLWLELHKENAALCVLPTGSGKGQVMMALLKKAVEAREDIRAIVLLNKVDLLKQTLKRFITHLEVKPSIYCGTEGTYDLSSRITIASIQSIFDTDLEKINLLVIDEAHAVSFEDGRYLQFIGRLRAKNANLKVVGFTATPYRAGGKIYGKDRVFPRICYTRTMRQMIAEGYLVKPIAKKTDHQLDVSTLRIRAGDFASEDVEIQTCNPDRVKLQVADALPRMEGRKKAVWCCSSINHAEMVHRALIEAGEDAAIVHSQMEKEDRDGDLYGRFQNGDARHLVFVTIVSEGYDQPNIDCIVLMRPMRSPTMYVQTCGRGLRTWEGKEDCLILDYGRVVETLGPLDRPRVPSRMKTRDLTPLTPMQFCAFCLSYFPKDDVICPDCNKESKVAKERNTRLASKADENAELLTGSTPGSTRMLVKSISLYKHRSSNGNDCLKVVYHPVSYLEERVQEFFVWNKNKGYVEGRARMQQFGVDAKELDDAVRAPMVKIPQAIEYVMDGRWKRVTKLHFDAQGKGAGKPDTGLS